MKSLKDRVNKGYEIDECTEQGVKKKKFIHSRRSRHNQKKSKEWGWNSPSHDTNTKAQTDTNTKAQTTAKKPRKRHRTKITRKSYETHRSHDTRRFYSPSTNNNKDVVKLLSLLGQYINGMEDSNHRSIYDKVINELLDDEEADLETITALLSAISVTNNEKQTDNYYEGITPSTTILSKEEIEQKKASIKASREAAVARYEEECRQQGSINNTTLAGGDDSDVNDLTDEMQGMSPSKQDNPNPSKRSKNNPNDGSDNKGGGSNGGNSGGSGSNNSDNDDDDDDEPMNDAELNDENILEKLVKDCAGGSWMFEPLRYILTYDGDNKLMLEMKCGVEEVIKIVKERLPREDIASAMVSYDEKIQKAVASIHEDYESLVNMGDGPILSASAMALLNYATTKESIRAWSKEVDGDWVKDPSSQRGKQSLMDPKASECLRMVVQTFARATLNAFRTTNGKDAIDSKLFCESIILLDMCFIAFDNPGNTEKGYNEKVEKIADNLNLEEAADELAAEIGGSNTSEKASEIAKRMLVFAASSIKYLFQSLHHRAEKAEHDPLPFIVFSSYPDKYWFKGKSGEVKRDLIHKIGTMYHPDFCLRKFGRAMSAEAIKEKNKILYNFYRRVKEVRKEMMTAIGDDGDMNIIDDISLIHQIFERVDKPMTDAEREEQYQLRLAGCKKGGNEAARLLLLAKAMEKVGWDASKLLPTAKEEYKYFMNKPPYDKGGAALLEKNMKSRLAGASTLLSLGKAIKPDGTFESDEDQAVFDDLLENVYNKDYDRLMQVIKNRLNGWFICRGVQELRLAFQSTASMLSVNPKDIISDKVLSNIGTVNEQLFNKIKDMTMVGELECIGKDRLYNMLNGGWAYFLNLPTVLSTFITFAKNKQIELDAVFTESTYKQMGQNLKDIVDACAGMTLNSTGNKEIGRQLLYEKLTIYHQARHSSEEVIKKHISKCKGFMKKNCRDGKWYVPKPRGDNQSTYKFINQIRYLEPGDYNYWKLQAFTDADVDLSNWKQSINEDMINEREIEARQGLRDASDEVLGEEEEVEVEEVVEDDLDY